MDVNQRQIALSVLESLRADLMYAHLNSGSRVLDVADLRQFIYEQMGRIRTNAFVLDGLYGADNGHGQDISKNNGHNGKVHSEEKVWRELSWVLLLPANVGACESCPVASSYTAYEKNNQENHQNCSCQTVTQHRTS
jgi:hypothetical protein